jgi:hypothetical protein
MPAERTRNDQNEFVQMSRSLLRLTNTCISYRNRILPQELFFLPHWVLNRNYPVLPEETGNKYTSYTRSRWLS